MTTMTKLNSLEQFLFRRNGKYPVIASVISVIHMIYLFYFYRMGIYPMATYNLVCIAGYLFFAAEAIKGNKINNFFVYLMIEVPLHAALATIFVGWNYRFMLIVMGSIPCIFYFVLFLEGFKHSIIFPTVVSIIYTLLYIGIRIYTHYVDPFYSNIRKADRLEIFFIYFNTLISFINIIFFNILTAIEYNYIREKLLSENSKLDTFATYDPLTNLLNRRSMDVHLRNILDKYYHEEDSFSIIMCDIDKFKSVNDTYGHDAGDYVLKEVSWILKDTVRDNDVVGRWGGEEFLIIVNSNRANASILAERIRSQVEQHTYKYKNNDLKVTITLGVSAYRANTDVSALIKSADMKLYRGKENGRNQVVS